jgi:hypothetical protein
MLANINLAKLQREFPLGASGDRVAVLFSTLFPLEDAKLEARRQSGSLIAGEVGRNTPNAKTFHHPDDSHVIVIYSSLVDFYELAAKIILGGGNVFYNRQVSIKAPDSIDGVVARLETLFRCWTPQGLADNLPSAVTVSALEEKAEELARFEAAASLLFLISHELGHVTYYRPPTEEDSKAESQLKPEEELLSDVSGMKLMVRSAQSPADARMRICGVTAAMRVLAVFESLGHVFGGSHPPPLIRLQHLWEATRHFCRTERDFYALTPLAYTVDQHLEEAGIRALGETGRPEASPERMFSALSAVMENVVKRYEPVEKVLEVMQFDFKTAPRPNLEELSMIAARLFPPIPTHTESAREDELWAAKADVFRSMKDQWPEPMRTLFKSAYTKLHGSKEQSNVNHRLS